MGRRDRAWPHHLGSLTGFCSARPQASKKFTHDAAFISGCPVSTPDPVYEIAVKCARPPRNDSEKAGIRFALTAMIERLTGSDSSAGSLDPTLG